MRQFRPQKNKRILFFRDFSRRIKRKSRRSIQIDAEPHRINNGDRNLRAFNRQHDRYGALFLVPEFQIANHTESVVEG